MYFLILRNDAVITHKNKVNNIKEIQEIKQKNNSNSIKEISNFESDKVLLNELRLSFKKES